MQLDNKDTFIRIYVKLDPELTKLSVKHLWIDYDQEADVLYLSFRKP